MKTTPEGWRGFATLGGIDLLVFLALVVASSRSALGLIALFPMVFYGVTVWLWSVPLAIAARRKGRNEYASGIVAAAAVTSLASAACWGIGLSIFSR